MTLCLQDWREMWGNYTSWADFQYTLCLQTVWSWSGISYDNGTLHGYHKPCAASGESSVYHGGPHVAIYHFDFFYQNQNQGKNKLGHSVSHL